MSFKLPVLSSSVFGHWFGEHHKTTALRVPTHGAIAYNYVTAVCARCNVARMCARHLSPMKRTAHKKKDFDHF